MGKDYRQSFEEWPRERLLAFGARALSDTELMSLMLGSGVCGRSVGKIATELVAVLDRQGIDVDLEKITSIHGVGVTKAASVLAAIEFARRRVSVVGTSVRQPSDVQALLRHLLDYKQEVVICFSLSGAFEVLAMRTITVGLVGSSQIHPREVFADVISDRASAIVLAHNHPSGQLIPSEQDKQVTIQIAKAGKLLGIPLVDHVIVSRRGYYSFQESGELNPDNS